MLLFSFNSPVWNSKINQDLKTFTENFIFQAVIHMEIMEINCRSTPEKVIVNSA